MVGFLLPKGFTNNQNCLVKNVIHTLNDVIDDFVIIDMYKSSKLNNVYECNNKIKFNDFDGLSFYECYNKFKEFLVKNKINTIFVFSSIFSENCKNGKPEFAKKIKNFIENEKDRKYVGNKEFISIDSNAKRFSLIYAACEICKKVIQLVIDPEELRINEYYDFEHNCFRQVYILNYGKLKYCPFYELGLFEETKLDSVKDNDLFAMYCESSRQRKKVTEKYKGIEHLMFYDSSKKLIKQSVYYDILSKSKYTFIIESFDIRTFSIIRFFEAISRGCVPLISEYVPLDHLFNTFKDIYDIIIKYGLVVKISNEDINKKMKELDSIRREIIYDFMNSKSLKAITNKEKLKKYYGRLLNNV